MDYLVVLIADVTEVELQYLLITLPSLIIADSSPNGLDGTMSYPLAPIAITTSQDALVSTGVIVSKQSQTMSPDVVSEVDPGGWQGGNFDPSNLPFNELWVNLSDLTGGDIPPVVYWIVLATWVTLFAGIMTFMFTQSIPWSAAVMMLFLLGFTDFGGGLIPLWVFFFFAVMAMGASVYSKVRAL